MTIRLNNRQPVPPPWSSDINKIRPWCQLHNSVKEGFSGFFPWFITVCVWSSFFMNNKSIIYSSHWLLLPLTPDNAEWAALYVVCRTSLPENKNVPLLWKTNRCYEKKSDQGRVDKNLICLSGHQALMKTSGLMPKVQSKVWLRRLQHVLKTQTSVSMSRCRLFPNIFPYNTLWILSVHSWSKQ